MLSITADSEWPIDKYYGNAHNALEIDFNLRREIFYIISSVNVSHQDESLPGSEIFHCQVGSKTYFKAKINDFFHFQTSKYPILHLIFDNWHFDKKLEPTGQWTAR